MTLQQIFNNINVNYDGVKSIANSIYTPYKLAIDSHYAYLQKFVDDADYYVGHNLIETVQLIGYATRRVIWLLEDFIDEMFLTAGSIESNIQTIFNYYMAWAITNIQTAVRFVQTEMYNEVDFLADNVNAAIFDLQDYLDSEVNAMHAEIDLLSIDVITWIDAAVANLADTLMGRIEEVNTNLTARVDFLEDWTAKMVQALYDYVDIRNTEMLAYINDTNSTLYFYINNRVKELDSYITSVQNGLNNRITYEVNILTSKIAATEISLTDKINELIDTTGWNFTFFDLFTFKPELSLLRVLLRPEAEFKRYKPYWQALFARILEED